MKRRIVILVVTVALIVSMIPVSGYSLSRYQNRNVISNNIQYIADYINQYGYVNNDGYKTVKNNDEGITNCVILENDRLIFYFYYEHGNLGDDDYNQIAANMYVDLPYSEYINISINELMKEPNFYKATSTFDPYDYILKSTKLTFYDSVGIFTQAAINERCNQVFEITLAAWNSLLKNKFGVTLSSLGFSQNCGHSWDNGNVINEPTCTAEGESVFTCINCGLERYESIPAVGHSYDSGVITKQATCIDSGEKVYTCSKCGGTKSEILPATGHSYNNGIITKKATCTDDGIKTFTCKNCGNFYNEAIPATGHSFDSGKVTKKASCTKDGKKTFTCINCGETRVETIDATGHDYNSGVVTEKAGKDEEGEITYTCKNDSDHEYFKEIPALNLKIKAKKSLFTVKATKVKKKAQNISKPITVKGAKTKITYIKSSGKANFKVNKSTGTITVKKGTKKGTYKIKVKVKTASNKKYKATTTTVTLKIKVK